jgi:tetratricopeptide (TPR) repeat protein
VIKQIDRRAHFERLIYIAITAFLLIVAIFGIPKLLDLAFPKTASIAILRFTSTTNDTSDSEILEVLPILLTEDLARCEHLTVIAPSTSLCYTPEPSQLKTITSQLLVDYLLLGTIQENRGHYSVTIQLFNSEQQRIANIGKLEGSLSTLSQVRIAILQAALKTMEIKSNLPEIKQSININAYTKYLKGIYQLQKESESAIDSAKILLRATIKTDTTFSLAYAAFAEAELRTNNLTDDPNSLRSAVEYAQRALRISPTIAIAHKVLGTSFRRIQKYDAALSSFSLSLEYLPQNPECYRELALLALTAGKYDYAIKYATNALNHDPQNPKSHLTLGLVQHLRKEYLLATNSYQKASQLGESDSILTVRYLMNAWIGDGKYENAIRYCQKMLSTSMRDYQYYYWLGRTYQLELKINIAQQWLQEGLSIIQKSIESNPNDTVAFAYAGLFYSRLGRFAEGEAAMNQAIQLDSSSAKILFRSANLYSIQRNKQKALTALNKGLQKKYDITELLNPDLSFILSEPEFLTTITREIKGYWPKK